MRVKKKISPASVFENYIPEREKHGVPKQIQFASNAGYY